MDMHIGWKKMAVGIKIEIGYDVLAAADKNNRKVGMGNIFGIGRC